jgi:hypothetical protein
MTLDFVGFRNVGDFYSPHYVDAVLEGDLKDVLAKWTAEGRAGGAKSPPRRLLALSAKYFGLIEKAATAKADERAELAKELHASVLDALGYDYAPEIEVIDDDDGKPVHVPTLATAERDGKAWLWAVGTPFGDEEDDPFDAEVEPGRSVRDLLDGALFRQEAPPRWVLYLAGSELLLVDRHKWAQGKYLAFSLGELFARRNETSFDVLAALLHRSVLAPSDGGCLLDTLDEASHKHAYGVSTDLKKGAREAIELLANEAIFHIRTVQKRGVFENDVLADQLTRECMVYLYRLLFLFYVEARGGEVGIAPMASDAYRTGYALDALRELELVQLTTQEAQDGTYLHESLARLFEIVNRGYGKGQMVLGEAADGFVVDGLRSPLFDADRTPLLRSVKLRNRALQRVIELLSLSEPKGKKERGRISYAQLGINQLGAVYESLLAYTGFFATEDLWEVQAGASSDEEGDGEARTYFIAKSRLKEFGKDELLKKDGKPVVHPKGTFIFRIAGRDREKSASYYTPEVLTACLTKYTLREAIGGVSADQILRVTVCEPAMGSGAFLNEAVNQLADAYLDRKQRELGTFIPAADYVLERQRVKDHFARHQVYGVDLNPLAKDLGAISLWLNVLHPGARAPWFGARLAIGNSLFGARREVFPAEHVVGESAWLEEVPEALPPDGKRPRGAVYHFLVADRGMASFDDDKVVKATFPAEVVVVKEWRKDQQKPWSPLDGQALDRISQRIDGLFAQHAADRRGLLEKTHQPLALFGRPLPEETRPRTVEECEDYAKLLAVGTAAGRRLAAVMDYWCALWVWPIERTELLPTRDEWLMEVEHLLEADVDVASEKSPRLGLVRELASKHRFFHWEVAFAEIFEGYSVGFDVVVGNPPWIKLEWKESNVLADFDPAIAVKDMSSSDAAKRRPQVLENAKAREAYFDELVGMNGLGAFLNARQNYPLLQGVQINLYKCFVTLAIRVGSRAGAWGLIHQKGLYDDVKAGALRAALSLRLRWHLHFINKLRLFETIKDEKHYEISIATAASGGKPSFLQVSNLLHPRTLDESLAHDGHGPVPGIKNDRGAWDLRGHRARVVPIAEETLAIFAALFDEPGTPTRQARLPVVHSVEILNVLRSFARQPKLGPPGDRWGTTREWHEGDRTKDGTIARMTKEPASASELIVSGPQFNVANPLSKTPNPGCKHNNDYSVVDLETAPNDFLPRTNYVRDVPLADYVARIPQWRGRPLFDRFRHMHREMLAPNGERTLVPALLPPGAASIGSVKTVAFADAGELALFNALASSIVIDYFVKSTGAGHAEVNLVQQLPLVSSRYDGQLQARALRLNCLTTDYAPLWAELFSEEWTKDSFAKVDLRLPPWSKLRNSWSRDSALRTAYARRQTLVEIDALAALALGLSADELCLVYRVQFPVLQQYERETFFDQNGRIVFTTNKGLPGVGLDRKEWEQVRDLAASDKPPGFAARFVPPFTACDREEDMREAYAAFRERIPKSIELADLPGSAWLRPRADAIIETKFALSAVVRAADGAVAQQRVRLALTFVLEPAWLTPLLAAKEANTWQRLVGPDAAPRPGHVTPLIPLVDDAFAKALAQLKTRKQLLADDNARTWASGNGLETVTAEWAEGRARFVLQVIDTLGIDSLLGQLPEDVRRSVGAEAA